jgi:hypothetical protein
LVVRWVVWFVVLWWFWMLLVGEWNHFEWIAATAAAAVGASLFELMRSVTSADARVPPVWLERAATVPWQIFVDFGIVTWALVRSALTGRVVRGVFRAHEFPADEGPGVRAWAAYAADFSPNAYVVEIDPDRNLALLHDLVPNRSSEQPA